VVTFGVEMSIGVAISFLFSITTLPALLSYSNLKSKKADNLVSNGMFAKAIHALPDKIYPKRKIIIVVTLLSLLPMLYLCSRVQVDTNFVRFFKDDAPIKQGLQYFDETYKGSLSLEFTLNSGKEDGIKEPAFLKRALEFQNYLVSLEGNGKAVSPINYLMKINQVMNDGNPAFYQVPESRNMVGQYLLLYSNSGPDEDLSDLMTFNGQEMRMSVLFAVAPSKLTKQRVETIEKYAAEHFPDLNIKVSGRAVLFNNMDTYTLTGMASSFALAFLTIAICFFVILRSFKFGLVALIPNVLPIIITGAVMGLFNLYLDFATMMVASTTLGIAVDDTIHVMNRFNKAKKANASNREAITVAMQESGVALISTTVVLVVGFSMLMLSSFVPNIYMGLLGCTTIGLAVLCDLYVLPAVIMSMGSDADEPVKAVPETYTNIDKNLMEQDAPSA
jgi:predicted RND superfamily exporter protein